MAEKVREISAPVSNYYGGPSVVLKDGRFYLKIEDYCGNDSTPVSVEFAEAWRAEFGGLSNGSTLEWEKE